ncbi:MAG: hypothetical protein HY278_06525 [candidate division NC10 bacterium]|nr:hypothetical protein [candidate division NC10 bacterium]
MRCHEAKTLLEREGKGGDLFIEDEALARHLAVCSRCSQAMKAFRLSSELLGALREEIEPGPSFYPRLRERLATSGVGEAGVIFFQAWGLARRLVPALALGVLLLAGVTVPLGGFRSPLPVQVGQTTEFHVFSLEELNLPAAVERPTQDQMLAFVLMETEGRGARPEAPGERSGK